MEDPLFQTGWGVARELRIQQPEEQSNGLGLKMH